ncbi:MAG TPA: DNA-processing protein DprA [Planctomycetota bacterium]|nr:DNA-processing protein DprA [Planctomycetota bacterium]
MAEDMIPRGSKPPSLEELLALQLTGGVGAVTYRKLLRAFGSVQGILAAPPGLIDEVDGVGPKRAASLASGRGLEDAAAEIRRAAELGVRLLPYTSDEYPPALKLIYDPPLVLYLRGELRPEDALALGVVGSRRCSYYGSTQAGRFAGELARLGFTVVSGLARGVDTAAHAGALSAGGRTLAVIGRGLAGVYPPENEDLARRIADGHGAVLSELPLEAPPARENFPRRNRLISGLSLGVIVVEGSRRSGAMITAAVALEQGREVYALPGKAGDPLAEGPNGLIKSAGAKLVETPQDVLDELGPVADALVGLELPERHRQAAMAALAGPREESARPAADARSAGLTAAERRVLEQLSSEPAGADEVIERAGLPPAEVASLLMVLEIRRLIRRLPGQRYVRTAG